MTNHLDACAAAVAAQGWPDWVTWTAVETIGHLKLAVAARGRLTVKVPPAATTAQVTAYTASKRYWLLNTAAKTRDAGPDLVSKELVSGEGFRLLGRNHRLNRVTADGRTRGDKLVSTRQPGAKVFAEDAPSWTGRSWWLTLREDATAADIMAWYRAQGQQWLDDNCPRMAARLGVPAGLTWSVRPPRVATTWGGTWGTYNRRTHHIAIDWKAFQLDRPQVEYIAGHEVAHAYPGAHAHTRGGVWWRAMDRLLPSWRDLHMKVKRGDGMRLWTGHVEPRPVPAYANTDTDGWDAFELEVQS